MRLRWLTLADVICRFIFPDANYSYADSSRKSLTDLDLRNNRVLEVHNLHNLPRLEHLNLGMSLDCILSSSLTNYRR
jgi:hypothetical protein